MQNEIITDMKNEILDEAVFSPDQIDALAAVIDRLQDYVTDRLDSLSQNIRPESFYDV